MVAVYAALMLMPGFLYLTITHSKLTQNKLNGWKFILPTVFISAAFFLFVRFGIWMLGLLSIHIEVIARIKAFWSEDLGILMKYSLSCAAACLLAWLYGMAAAKIRWVGDPLLKVFAWLIPAESTSKYKEKLVSYMNHEDKGTIMLELVSGKIYIGVLTTVEIDELPDNEDIVGIVPFISGKRRGAVLHFNCYYRDGLDLKSDALDVSEVLIPNNRVQSVRVFDSETFQNNISDENTTFSVKLKTRLRS